MAISRIEYCSLGIVAVAVRRRERRSGEGEGVETEGGVVTSWPASFWGDGGVWDILQLLLGFSPSKQFYYNILSASHSFHPLHHSAQKGGTTPSIT